MPNSVNIQQWEKLLEDVDKHRIPVEFLKKLVVKLVKKRQMTINIDKLFKQGLTPELVEVSVGRQLEEIEPMITGIDFVLNIEKIAESVQPQTDMILKDL
jgi:hypothetical protein